MDVTVGRVHGDLHAQNVVADRRDDGETFVLVDLTSYDPAGSLDRDVVTLILSVTAYQLHT